MFAIEKAESVDDLEDDEGFETLDAKLRDAWNGITKGILVKEIQLADQILKEKKGTQLNGRQISWMVGRKFDQDLKEGSIDNEREVHDLMLIGDNEVFQRHAAALRSSAEDQYGAHCYQGRRAIADGGAIGDIAADSGGIAHLWAAVSSQHTMQRG